MVLAQPGDGTYRRLSEVLQRYHGSPGYPLARFGSLEVHCKCTYHCKCNYHCKVVCILPFPWALDSIFCSILSRESRGIPSSKQLGASCSAFLWGDVTLWHQKSGEVIQSRTCQSRKLEALGLDHSGAAPTPELQSDRQFSHRDVFSCECLPPSGCTASALRVVPHLGGPFCLGDAWTMSRCIAAGQHAQRLAIRGEIRSWNVTETAGGHPACSHWIGVAQAALLAAVRYRRCHDQAPLAASHVQGHHLPGVQRGIVLLWFSDDMTQDV